MVGGLVAEAMWWVAGSTGNKANSVPTEVGVEVGTELGNLHVLSE